MIVLHALAGIDWNNVWQHTVRAVQTVGKVLWTLLRYFVLLEITILAIFFWMVEGVVDGIRRNPTRLILGMNPIGAAAIIRWTTSKEVWALSQGRFWIGKYIQKFHPRLYSHPVLNPVLRPLFRKRRIRP